MIDLGDVEKRIGLVFADKSLLLRALVHSSYRNEHPGFSFEDNERLEFLGDAALGFITGEHLYHRFPEVTEGALTTLRAALVRRDALAEMARRFDLGSFLMMGAGAHADKVHERPATLCAAFEALVGAIYLDQGLEQTREFLQPLIGPAAVAVHENHSDRDWKSRLQDMAQGLARGRPNYTTISETGPDHAPEFVVQVTIGGETYGGGSGPSKQMAEQAAAQAALQRLEDEACSPAPEEQEGPGKDDPQGAQQVPRG
ncbi:MAG TPA: ribonuclease III [Anaerolineae bacterium]|nr:ribonuclease III [Anaerolineae bacterium]